MLFGKELLIKQSSKVLGNIADNGGALYFMADEQDRQLNDYKFKLDPFVDLKTVRKPDLNRLKHQTVIEFQLFIKSSSFRNNSALTDGGAIATDSLFSFLALLEDV